MTLRWLEVFLAVAHHLNVSVAARALHVTQPTISQTLKLLQKAVGAQLIQKTRSGISLTPAGEAFRQKAISIAAELDALATGFSSAALDKTSQRLAIGASSGPGASIIPNLLARFAREQPAANVLFCKVDRSDTDRLLLTSKIEVAVTTYCSSSWSLQVEPFRTENLAAFVRRDHTFANISFDLRGLAKIPLVIKAGRGRESRTENLLRSLSQAGYGAKIAIRCECVDAVKNVVRSGAGIGLLFYDSISEELQRGEFVSLSISGLKLSSQSYIMYATDRPLSPIAREFLSMLRAARFASCQETELPATIFDCAIPAPVHLVR